MGKSRTEGCKSKKVADENHLLKVVHFTHPGGEFPVEGCKGIGSKQEVSWRTDGRHCRRLVCHKGQYIDRNWKFGTDNLAFWSEWEGPTTATRISLKGDPFFARFVHRVRYPYTSDCDMESSVRFGCGNGEKRQSGCGEKCGAFMDTDPCVFGRTFKYSHCRQGASSSLRGLSLSSLVVFGSYKRGIFLLDTVFVVDGGVGYKKESVCRIACSEAYKNLTLRRVAGEHEHTFYRGVKYDEKAEVFSFTPARVCGEEGYGKRCMIKDLAKLNRLLNKQIFKYMPGFSIAVADKDKIKKVWNEIVRQVMAQGFVLGVHFGWPAKI